METVSIVTEDLRVTILSPYPFWTFEQARQVHNAGVLERVLTTVPSARVAVPGKLVESQLTWSGLRHVGRRVVPRLDPILNRIVIREFDRWAASHLGRPSVISGLSGYGTDTLADAAHRGIAVCCDRGSWHIEEQRRVLHDEADRLGIPRHRFDPFIVERELREYALASRLLVPSEGARNSFIRQGIEPQRIVKIPYGVDLNSFRATSLVPREPGRIVSVGTVGLRKGHVHLLEAFRTLQSPHASLSLVGAVAPGWYERLMLNQDGIRVTGAVSREQVVTELNRASIFALASIEDGFGLVIAQAMATGLPVIATEATGIRELVTDGVEGLVVPPSDGQALANAIESLLIDPERGRMMGAAGRRKVESLGGWDRYGRQVVKAFREARHTVT